MTTQHTDPIQEIKTTEEDARKKIEQKEAELNIELKKFQKDLEKKEADFENALKDRGNEKLEKVKKEAGELYKSKMSASEGERNKTIRDAESKQKVGIDAVIDAFKQLA